ncbi:MAG: trimethylamine methyltransferase family protein [Magnetovibrio sp.]|nr:trimethylamine methyltransferase family protein [Magnetovibrio sp.]
MARQARRGGRAARRAERAQAEIEAQAAAPAYVTRKIPLTELCGEEGLDIIEANAETILEEIGLEFQGEEDVLALWKGAGADVDGSRVRFPKGLVRSLMATAPASYTQHARNPERSVVIGGDNIVFAPVYGPPFVTDLDEGRRYGTMADFEKFVKLAYMAPGIHHSGGTVCEPVDVPVNKRHLDMIYAHMRYSDKPFMGSVTAPERAADTVAMAGILFGDDFVDANTVCTSLINVNSPMTYDGVMLGALKTYAAANQAVIVTPFIMSGAMGPASVAGTLAQALAEATAGIALTQVIRPGAPVIFGLFSSSLSMQSGAPTFGTPEPTLVLSAAAQLARRMKLPFRSGGNLCASKLPDSQAAYESVNSAVPGLLCGVNFMLHGAGWLEGGLASSYEKFIMDCDQLGMLATLARGYDFSENGQAMDAVREVGPGGHYLGCAHTQANFETAFYRSNVSDNNSFEQWEADGGLDQAQRANAVWKQWLDDYEAPPLDAAKDEALHAFIAERKGSMEDSWT